MSGLPARVQPRAPLDILLTATLLILPLATARAQSGGGVETTGTGGAHTIQGRIYISSGQSADMRAKVRLESTNHGERSVLASANGEFSFRNLEPGPYTIVVEAGDPYEVARESVSIDREISRGAPRTLTVPIYLRVKGGSAAAPPGVIDAGLASVPKAARDLYQKALDEARAGRSQQAVAHLKEAIALHPEFPLALNELGVQYMKLGQVERAIETLRSALKLKPESFTPRLNYGIALYQNRKFAEAETELRQALKQNESSPGAQLYLGLTLINLRRNDEAEQSLLGAIRSGGDEMSLAHYYLGGIYWGRREYKRAADELETYLRLAPKAPDAERIRTTIKELRSKP